jgi:putative FmdB family regulatory protein
MPLYEYRCNKCGKGFEKLTSFRDAAKEQTCPICGSTNVERLVSSFAVGTKSGGSTECPTCTSGVCSLDN